ncbi:MAG: kynureninase [Sphingomonadaceae bacterium]|nr:kynureninase [Sphingomonadaceae bacterium]
MTRDHALQLDAADPLAFARDRFSLPEGVFYLDGNSLGVLPRSTPARIADVVSREWGRDLIRSWNSADWIGAPARIGALIAPLIGAAADEVIAADSVSVNLYKLLHAALSLRPERRVIVTEPGNFPTDLYVAQGLAAAHPDVEVRSVEPDAIEQALSSDVAVLMLTHVHYKSARVHDMARLTAAAHAAGALALWDLSHSAGALPVNLNDCVADFAVGCGYKYLNGGPGAPAFLFAAARHHAAMRSPLTGWMGHAQPFSFVDDYAPAEGMARFLCGTPPILSFAALEEGLRAFDGVDLGLLVAKSRSLSGLLIARMAEHAPDLELASPADPLQRGSHVVFAHPCAYEICQALIAARVIGDFRAPDLLRLGLTPLYLSHADVWDATEIVGEVMRTGAWRDPAYAVRSRVT